MLITAITDSKRKPYNFYRSLQLLHIEEFLKIVWRPSILAKFRTFSVPVNFSVHSSTNFEWFLAAKIRNHSKLVLDCTLKFTESLNLIFYNFQRFYLVFSPRFPTPSNHPLHHLQKQTKKST